MLRYVDLLSRQSPARIVACRAGSCCDRCGMGMGTLALANVMSQMGLGAETSPSAVGPINPLAPKMPQFAPKAKRVIHLFMNGGPSQVDTFDPKPALDEVRRQAAADAIPAAPSARPARPWRRRSSSSKYGQSGIEVSELFPHVAESHRRHLRHPLDARRRAEPRAVAAADELRRGAAWSGPSIGSWVTLRPRQREPEPARLHRRCAPAATRSRNRRTGSPASCPASTRARTSTRSTRELEKLIENIRNDSRLAANEQREQLDLLQQLNDEHQQQRGRTTPQLEARIQSFELAYRMQMEAADAFDVSREPQAHPRHVRRRRPGAADA